jgi:F-type H+-transporting ATPase subunit a
MNLLNFFVADDGPHITITSDKLLEIAGLTITNSMLYGWICASALIVLLIMARRRITLNGSLGIPGVIESVTEFIVNLLQSTLGSREKAVRLAPIFVTLFFFIMLNNWLGLLPGVGAAVEYNGNPLLRPFTADLNGTLAMAVFGMTLVQILAIKESGARGHFKHYFPLRLINPLTYLIGAFEIFTEFTRLFSLGLRLFLNIAVGEILISVAAYLGGPVASIAALPFTLLEIFVGVLQAYIFVVLCAAYLSATTTAHAGEEHEEAPHV